jgi:DNA-binding transcriptional LysR family regulator
MNIRQLETFYWIAQLGTFSAAAERLHTSQANVSARIRELEEELSVSLFDRIGRQVLLTMKARELLVHAEKVVAEAARLRLAAGKPDMVQGVIKIGLGEAIATRSLAPIVDELKRRYPEMEVEFDIDLNAHLQRKLTRGAVDIGLFGGPVEAPELKFVPIGAMPVTWVGAPSFFEGRSTVTQADFATMPIISLPREARLYTLLQDWFSEGAVTPKRVSYCNNITTMLHVARAGLCACMVPAGLVATDLANGTLQAPTAVPPIATLKFFVATRLESVDPAIAEIASIVAEVTRLPEIGVAAAQPIRGAFGQKSRVPR